MAPIWESLFANLALVSILVVVWDLLSDRTAQFSKSTQSVFLGLIMGGGAAASMAMAEPIHGFLFDLRIPLVAASAFFGGVPAVVVAASVALPAASISGAGSRRWRHRYPDRFGHWPRMLLVGAISSADHDPHLRLWCRCRVRRLLRIAGAARGSPSCSFPARRHSADLARPCQRRDDRHIAASAGEAARTRNRQSDLPGHGARAS